MSSKVHVSGGRPPLRYDVLSINIGSAPKVHLGFLETVRDTRVPPDGTSSGFKWIYFWKKGAHESGKIWKVFGTRKEKKKQLREVQTKTREQKQRGNNSRYNTKRTKLNGEKKAKKQKNTTQLWGWVVQQMIFLA